MLSSDVLETRNNEVHFEDKFKNKAFSDVIDYIYSGNITLSIDNITDIFEISNYLQVTNYDYNK